MSNVATKVAEHAKEIDELLSANLVTDLSTATGIVLSIVFLKVVNELTRRHTDGHITRRSDRATAPLFEPALLAGFAQRRTRERAGEAPGDCRRGWSA